MARTYSEMVDLIESILIDGGIDPDASTNEVFATAEIDAVIPMCLVEVSKSRPYQVKYPLNTLASKEIAMTDSMKWKLLRIRPYIEYPTLQEPQRFHNITRFADTLRIEVDTTPTLGEATNLFLDKVHVLQSAIGTADVSGKLNGAVAIGDETINLDNLGTGTINDGTILMIGSDATLYRVCGNYTIAANAASGIIVCPPIAAVTATASTVGIYLAESTMDEETETIFADLVAAKLAINKARSFIGTVPVGGRTSNTDMMNWGLAKQADARQQLKGLVERIPYIEYSRS
jgi:hypothetical protein